MPVDKSESNMIKMALKMVSAQAIFLHCIKQHTGPGGLTMLCDGFKAANQLKQVDPEAYRVLSETLVGFRDIGEDFRKFDKLNWATILRLVTCPNENLHVIFFLH